MTAARAHGLAALDSVHNEIEDLGQPGAACRQGADFGFDGKSLIHPSHLAIANAAFTPDADEVAWARAVIAAFDAPENAGKGALRVGGRLAERLHRDQALRLVEIAEADRGAGMTGDRLAGVHQRPDLSYGAYLGLDRLLAAQHPRSGEHDELLFIVIHQASELWLKLSLHELEGARDCIRRDDLGPAFKMISRVSRIQTQLIQSWDVLATMTPSDYSAIREGLGQSSGFQSWQYRLLEFMLGQKDAGDDDGPRAGPRDSRSAGRGA